jgi:ABC-type sulfate/molybdate transport systems ATPase subunit
MLKSGANVLLLDEPTNDLDVEVLRNLEEVPIEALFIHINLNSHRKGYKYNELNIK